MIPISQMFTWFSYSQLTLEIDLSISFNIIGRTRSTFPVAQHGHGNRCPKGSWCRETSRAECAIDSLDVVPESSCCMIPEVQWTSALGNPQHAPLQNPMSHCRRLLQVARRALKPYKTSWAAGPTECSTLARPAHNADRTGPLVM